MNPPTDPPPALPRSSARLWLFRVLTALGVPVLLLLALEGGLRLAGYGHRADFLIPDTRPGYYRTNPDFVSLFMPGSFDLRPLNFRVALRKPPDTVRIVILGESAAEGIPVPSFGFAPQLRAQLRARYPGKHIEILNTGIVAINSHVVYRIACDLARFSPDAYVIYVGNNEVVGPYGPGCAYLSVAPPLWSIRLSAFVRSTRTGQAMSALLARLRHRGAAPEWGGMEMFVDQAVAGDDPRLETVYRNFAANLADIVRVAHGAGAKTLLCTVVSNLKDCAPLLSRHRPGMTAADTATWQRVFTRARIEWLLGDTAPARRDLEEALALDPQYADTAYMLGSLELQAGDTAAARAHLVAAEHWDALRFRPDPRINEIVRDVARREHANGLLDAAMLLGSDPASTAPPTGREFLFEHVHFDWAGNYALARAMAERLGPLILPPATATGGWLDSTACAAALGYTPYERYTMLEHNGFIVRRPPFTNTLTYPIDMARLDHELTRARTDRDSPAVQRQALAVVQAAAARDPDNATLAKLEEDIDEDLGDIPGALAAARRNQALQPENFALAGDEAIKLSQLGRYDEARALLTKAAATCTPRDLALLAPAFADLFTRTQQFAEGRRYLDGLIAQRPGDASLRLLRARLARSAGDPAAAETEYRSVLAADPSNPNALEALVDLLGELKRPADVATVSLAAAPHQPQNEANNLRAALVEESRGHEPEATKLLLAAERSGPITSAVEIRLARKYFAERRLDDILLHLAYAKQISFFEGNPNATKSIDEIVWQIRAAIDRRQ